MRALVVGMAIAVVTAMSICPATAKDERLDLEIRMLIIEASRGLEGCILNLREFKLLRQQDRDGDAMQKLRDLNHCVEEAPNKLAKWVDRVRPKLAGKNGALAALKSLVTTQRVLLARLNTDPVPNFDRLATSMAAEGARLQAEINW